jgi:hypothetical protein
VLHQDYISNILLIDEDDEGGSIKENCKNEDENDIEANFS